MVAQPGGRQHLTLLTRARLLPSLSPAFLVTSMEQLPSFHSDSSKLDVTVLPNQGEDGCYSTGEPTVRESDTLEAILTL